jgi:retron-type reverse transcriptase
MPKSKYALRDSAFFRLRTKAKLADVLQISQSKMKRLTKLENGYFAFQKPKKDGTMRDISAPIPPLKSVQARIADLLRRVAPPDYLFAPVEGRSYVDNAARHIGSRSFRLLDIEDFFPSCTFNKVLWFFRTRMECSPDVAYILAKIATENNVLPQGSPCSPILAYFAYIDMWTEIDECVRADGCKLSVYADDLTMSGETVHERAAWEIKSILYRHGHKYAKHKERSRRDRAVEVTGVMLTRDGVKPPNRQQHKIAELRVDLGKAKPSPHKTTMEAQLRGRLAQLGQIQAGNDS